MKKLKQNYHFLHVLSRSSPAQKRALLRSANKGQILSLCEICLNVLSGNVPCQVKKLHKYRNILRKIAKKSTKLAHKKKIFINQSGGFLPLILRTVGPILSGLLGQALGNLS